MSGLLLPPKCGSGSLEHEAVLSAMVEESSSMLLPPLTLPWVAVPASSTQAFPHCQLQALLEHVCSAFPSKVVKDF